MSDPKTDRWETFASAVRGGKSIWTACTLARLTPRESSSRGYFVYALSTRAKGRVFYIGKGRGSRHRCHLRDWKAGEVTNRRKHAAISRLMRRGEEPLALILMDDLDEWDACKIEERLIASLRGFLTNVKASDSGVKRRTLAKVFELAQRLKPFDQWLAEDPAHHGRGHIAMYNFIRRSLGRMLREAAAEAGFGR